MQKLVTIYLDNSNYTKGRWTASSADKHAMVEEHLEQYLSDGWAIKSVTGFGGSGETYNVRGWIAVVLEK